MLLLMVQPKWSHQECWRTKYARDYIAKLDPKLPEFDPDNAEKWIGYSYQIVVTQTEFVYLSQMQLHHEDLTWTIMNAREVTHDLEVHVEEFSQKMERVDQLLNQKAGVATHNSWLNSVNDTMLCNDYCTDMLQEHLNDGWRIVSVCPQPDSRRPDYILGRVSNDDQLLSIGPSARRG